MDTSNGSGTMDQKGSPPLNPEPPHEICPPGCIPAPIPRAEGGSEARRTLDSQTSGYPQGLYPQMPPALNYLQGIPVIPLQTQPDTRCGPYQVQSPFASNAQQQNERLLDENEEPSVVGFQAVKLIRKICRKPPPQCCCPPKKHFCATTNVVQIRPPCKTNILYNRPRFQFRKCECCITSPPPCPLPPCRPSCSSNLQGSCRDPPVRPKVMTPKACESRRLFLCQAADSCNDQVLVLKEVTCNGKDPWKTSKPRVSSQSEGRQSTSVETQCVSAVGTNTENNTSDASRGASGSAYGGMGLATGSHISNSLGLTPLGSILGAASTLGPTGTAIGMADANNGNSSNWANLLGMGLSGFNGLSPGFDPAFIAALAGIGYGGGNGLGCPGMGSGPNELEGRCEEESRQRKYDEVGRCDSCDSFERWRLKCECRKKMRDECDKKSKDGGNDAKGNMSKSVSVNTSEVTVDKRKKKDKDRDKKGKKNKKKK